MTEFEYDAEGRLVKELYTNSDIERTYEYDSDGNLIRVAGTDGNRVRDVTLTAYNEQGQKIEEKSQYGNESGEIVTIEWRVYTYNEDGKLIREQGLDPEGVPLEEDYTVYTYDENGNLLTQEYCYGDMGGSMQYHYDEDGNLAEEVFISRSNETSTTAYRYDRGGNLIETVVDTNYGHSRTEYEYRRA